MKNKELAGMMNANIQYKRDIRQRVNLGQLNNTGNQSIHKSLGPTNKEIYDRKAYINNLQSVTPSKQ